VVVGDVVFGADLVLGLSGVVAEVCPAAAVAAGG